MRRAAHNVAPSSGQPSSRSTAKPSRRASQHSASHSPAAPRPRRQGVLDRDGLARWSGRRPRRRRPGQRRASSDGAHPAPGLVLALRPAGGGEDLDAFLVPADLTSHRVPCLVSPDQGRAGIWEEISRMFAKVSPCSRAAACRHLAQSPGVRSAWASSCRRARRLANLRWRSSSCSLSCRARRGCAVASGAPGSWMLCWPDGRWWCGAAWFAGIAVNPEIRSREGRGWLAGWFCGCERGAGLGGSLPGWWSGRDSRPRPAATAGARWRCCGPGCGAFRPAPSG